MKTILINTKQDFIVATIDETEHIFDKIDYKYGSGVKFYPIEEDAIVYVDGVESENVYTGDIIMSYYDRRIDKRSYLIIKDETFFEVLTQKLDKKHFAETDACCQICD